jgi:hypothetical protein
MRYLVFLTLLLSGCAAQVVEVKPKPEPAFALPAATAYEYRETAYEVGTYCDRSNPALRHEAHTVYRRTRIPAKTTGSASVTTVSVKPLSESAELGAEISTQKQITEKLREIQASMAEQERQMKEQYALLVRQNAEVLKLRRQLEEARAKGAVSKAGASESKETTVAKAESKEAPSW